MWRGIVQFWYKRLNTGAVGFFRSTVLFLLRSLSFLVPMWPKAMLFESFGGKRFDDSPKAIYDEVCRRPEFTDWTLIWSFREPEKFEVSRGRKVEMYSPLYFWILLRSRVRISNTQARSTDFSRKGGLRVETGHGCGPKRGMIYSDKGPADGKTIRCAAGEFNVEIFSRNYHAAKEAFLRCGLPRNDALFQYTEQDIMDIQEGLHIPESKRVILYMPTWRDHLRDEHGNICLTPPMDLKKWEATLGEEYVLLIRAHHMVMAALNLEEGPFVRDVSDYPVLTDLYMIADLMITDYSSAVIDYSILDRPILCFAYDLEEYTAKVKLEWPLEGTLPCPVDRDEDSLLERIQTLDFEEYSKKTREFHQRFAPYEKGHAAQTVVDEMQKRLGLTKQ